jgi:broad specificity phosphatase PhoE
MAQPDNPKVRPFTRTRWWWIRHAPVRAHGGQIYGQADLACDCGDEVVLQSVARVLPKGAVWVSSHLSRARHTAEALWRSGYLDQNEATPPLRSVPEFAEQHLGEWQGLDRARFAAGRPAMAASYWYAPADERPSGGESFAEVCARVRVAVDRLTDEFRGRDIVAVAHGGSIRAALAIALNLDPQAVLAFAVENCSLTRLDYLEGQSGSGWRIGTVNQQPWTGQQAKLQPQSVAPNKG